MLSNSYVKYIIPLIMSFIIIMSIVNTIVLNHVFKKSLLNGQNNIITQTPANKIEKLLGLGLPPIPQKGRIKFKVRFGEIIDPEPEPGNYFIILKNKDFPTVIIFDYPPHEELYKELGNCFLDTFIGFVIDNESFRGFWKSGAGCLKSYINYVRNHEKELNITIIWVSQDLVPGSKDYRELYGWGSVWTINSKFVGKLIKILELAGLSEIIWLEVGIFARGPVNAKQAVEIILEKLPRDIVMRATAHDEGIGVMLVKPKLEALSRVLEVVKDLGIALGIMSAMQVQLR